MTKPLLGSAALLLALALSSGCARPQAEGDAECDRSEDCDDGVDCTVDLCEAGTCAHQTMDALCDEGQSCDATQGCIGGGCTNDDQCDDGIECTFDLCESTGSCTHRPMDSLCQDDERCDLEAGCVAAGCASDEQCDDGIECTIDLCGEGGECEHIPDNSLCPDDQVCRPDSGCREIDCERDEDCDDGIFCNGRETCHPEFGCLPAEEPEDCDDNDECTVDHCDTDLDQCVYEVNTDIPECDTFDPERHLNGCFQLTPGVNQSCFVSFSFDQVCFSLVGPVLTIQAGPHELTQNPAPTDANFSASREVSGGCTEVYTLTGTFTGSSHFVGTWSARFIQNDGFSCSLSGCTNYTIPLEGDRIP